MVLSYGFSLSVCAGLCAASASCVAKLAMSGEELQTLCQAMLHTENGHLHFDMLDCIKVRTYTEMKLLIEIFIHKPCTDSCGGLRIEPVTIDKHVDF